MTKKNNEYMIKVTQKPYQKDTEIIKKGKLS